jgi:hypothetical protein
LKCPTSVAILGSARPSTPTRASANLSSSSFDPRHAVNLRSTCGRTPKTYCGCPWWIRGILSYIAILAYSPSINRLSCCDCRGAVSKVCEGWGARQRPRLALRLRGSTRPRTPSRPRRVRNGPATVSRTHAAAKRSAGRSYGATSAPAVTRCVCTDFLPPEPACPACLPCLMPVFGLCPVRMNRVPAPRAGDAVYHAARSPCARWHQVRVRRSRGDPAACLSS